MKNLALFIFSMALTVPVLAEEAEYITQPHPAIQQRVLEGIGGVKTFSNSTYERLQVIEGRTRNGTLTMHDWVDYNNKISRNSKILENLEVYLDDPEIGEDVLRESITLLKIIRYVENILKEEGAYSLASVTIGKILMGTGIRGVKLKDSRVATFFNDSVPKDQLSKVANVINLKFDPIAVTTEEKNSILGQFEIVMNEHPRTDLSQSVFFALMYFTQDLPEAIEKENPYFKDITGISNEQLNRIVTGKDPIYYLFN